MEEVEDIGLPWMEALDSLRKLDFLHKEAGLARESPLKLTFGTIFDANNVSAVAECDSSHDRIMRLSNSLEKLSWNQQLTVHLQLYRLLERTLEPIRKRVQVLEDNQEHSKLAQDVDLETVLKFARRISPHVRAPPEYDDPTGIDGFCVPGYFFPCPDRLMMSKSSLFHADVIRGVPPSIEFISDSRTRAMFWVELVAWSSKATIFYAINSMQTWNIYNDDSKPFLTGPGFYTVRAYCQAKGFLTSEVSVADINVPGVEDSSHYKTLLEIQERSRLQQEALETGAIDDNKQAAPSDTIKKKHSLESLGHIATERKRRHHAPVSKENKFGGLFLTMGEEENSDDDDEIDSNEES